ncbi:hypothetical protein SERLA73DRAFT_134798 [Serpula lacrymans var. lacrymans S7.3]|uniref:Uncharacterized protein n=1 Tax=Serpula lacrymans var. lacrymans (strain S7.3) TaxID=936435 RepID=F8PVU1_SERL3|nr:hypothetical protein SERLA73DRAFT_134798 [Serpula lacrymans var. lacrymans S7.3]
MEQESTSSPYARLGSRLWSQNICHNCRSHVIMPTSICTSILDRIGTKNAIHKAVSEPTPSVSTVNG